MWSYIHVANPGWTRCTGHQEEHYGDMKKWKCNTASKSLQLVEKPQLFKEHLLKIYKWGGKKILDRENSRRVSGYNRIWVVPLEMGKMRIQPEAGRCLQSEGCEGCGLTAPSQERGRKAESQAKRKSSAFVAPRQMWHQYSHQHLADVQTTTFNSVIKQNSPSYRAKITRLNTLNHTFLHNTKMYTAFPSMKNPIIRKVWILKKQLKPLFNILKSRYVKKIFLLCLKFKTLKKFNVNIKGGL